MELLQPFRLRLSPGGDDAHFRVAVSAPSQFGEGETECGLPFFKNGNDWQRTIRNSVGAHEFDPAHFCGDGEQDWMVQAGLLTQNGSDFHRDIYENIGQTLYKALFPEGSVNQAFQYAKRLAQEQQTKLHLQLQIDAGYARLHDYPWELVHDGQNFLAHCEVTFSRYITFGGVPPKLRPTNQVNVLLVSSSAFDKDNNLDEIDKNEQKAVRQVLKQAERDGHIRLAEIKPTYKNLDTHLTTHGGDKVPHVIHFDGHGIFGSFCKQCRKVHKSTKIDKCTLCGKQLSKPQGYLVFENDVGEGDYISAEKLSKLLGQQWGVAVVVLSACQSGLSLGSDSVFNGIAQNLISQRVPALVAMQYTVSVDAAVAFAEKFYLSLSQKNALAKAVTLARLAMDIEGNQWYRPVLYLRWHDNESGQLFAETGHLDDNRAKDIATAKDGNISLKNSNYRPINVAINVVNVVEHNVKNNCNKSRASSSKRYNNLGVEKYYAFQSFEAVSNFQKSLERNHKFAEAYYNLGVNYEDRYNFIEARKQYQKAIEAAALDAAYNNLARLYIIIFKKYDKAVELCLKGLQQTQNDTIKYVLLKNLGWARLQQKSYSEAKACLEDAIDLAWEQAPAHGLLAQVMEVQGDMKGALVEWENFLKYASSYNPDEDPWITMARKRLKGTDNQ